MWKIDEIKFLSLGFTYHRTEYDDKTGAKTGRFTMSFPLEISFELLDSEIVEKVRNVIKNELEKSD